MKTIDRYRKHYLSVIVLFAAVLPLFASPYTLTTFIRIIYFGLLSMSVGMLIGQLGVVSMAQTAFFAMGAYFIGLVGFERNIFPFPWVDILGVLFTALVAFLFGMVAMRVRDMVFMMITLAFGQVCWSLGTQNTSLLHGWLGIVGIRPYTILGIDFTNQAYFYWACLIIFILVTYVYMRITNTTYGLALNGIKENSRRMEAMGYQVYWIKVVFFVIAAAVASLGGIIMFYNTGIITPSSMHMSRTSWILLCVILGGATYFWGPVLGTIIAVWADVLISQMTMRYTTILGLIFLLIVLFAPQGLLGLIDSLRNKHDKKNELLE